MLIDIEKQSPGEVLIEVDCVPKYKVSNQPEGVKVFILHPDEEPHPVAGCWRNIQLGIGYCLLHATNQSLFTLSSYSNAGLSW